VALVLLPQFRHLSSVPVCFDLVPTFSKLSSSLLLMFSTFLLFFEALTHLDLSGEYLATILLSGSYHDFPLRPLEERSDVVPTRSALYTISTLA